MENQDTYHMASRTHHHQLVPLQFLPNAAPLHSYLTSYADGASRPNDANTSTGLNEWTRELKVGSLAFLLLYFF